MLEMQKVDYETSFIELKNVLTFFLSVKNKPLTPVVLELLTARYQLLYSQNSQVNIYRLEINKYKTNSICITWEIVHKK